jgi:dienelactone hydrolase
MSTPDDVLTGWTRTTFDAAGVSHDVYRRGSGAGVVLLPEIPGMTPEVIGLAQALVDAGFTVAVPSLFGTPGRVTSGGYAAASFASACISREFRAFARRADRPVAEFVRALARSLHAEVGGSGVGVIGMCFSGGFALAAAVEPSVLAPVLSQPSVPLPLGSARRRDTGMSDGELATVVERTRTEGLCALGLRFSEDSAAPRDRFAVLAEALGEGWRAIELDSSPGNPDGFVKRDHSVLTHPTSTTPGTPTYRAREEVVTFLRERLTA